MLWRWLLRLGMRHVCPVGGKISVGFLISKLLEASHWNAALWTSSLKYLVLSIPCAGNLSFEFFSLLAKSQTPLQASTCSFSRLINIYIDYTQWNRFSRADRNYPIAEYGLSAFAWKVQVRNPRGIERNWVLVSHILNRIFNHWVIKGEQGWGLC